MARNLRKRTYKPLIIEESDSEEDSGVLDVSWTPFEMNTSKSPKGTKKKQSIQENKDNDGKRNKPVKAIQRSEKASTATRTMDVSDSEDEQKPVVSDMIRASDEGEYSQSLMKTKKKPNSQRNIDNDTKPIKPVKRSAKKASTSVPAKVRKVDSNIICISDSDSDSESSQSKSNTPQKKLRTPQKTSKTSRTTSSKVKKLEVNNNAKPKEKIWENKNPADVENWTIDAFVSQETNIPPNIVKNVLQFFRDDISIPFIARYRKAATNGMEADKLREIKFTAQRAQEVKNRARTVLNAVDKSGNWTPELHRLIQSTTSMDTLEEIYNVFKPPPKLSLLQKSRESGMQSVVDRIINCRPIDNLESYVNPDYYVLANVSCVRSTIRVLLADDLCRHQGVIQKVEEYQKFVKITTERVVHDTWKNKDKRFNPSESRKYARYWQFTDYASRIKPYQVLAINRGVKTGYLKLKHLLEPRYKNTFKEFCKSLYRRVLEVSPLHRSLLIDAIDQFIDDNLESQIERRVRRMLNTTAATAALADFTTNFKNLLLTPPVRGKIVLGIDPGFKNGCKLAVVSEQGAVLDEGYAYLDLKDDSDMKSIRFERALIDLILKHKCTLIALGNGTGCRETEEILLRINEKRMLGTKTISYCIVTEAGVSAYSVSDKARAEFPGKDPNLISAISIARRLQDFVAEAVKVDPECLGVGMYQKDIPEKLLKTAMDDVVTEVVSFLGIDINTASEYLLIKVAGIGPSKAKSIITYRNEHGPIKNRSRITAIPGFGPRTFQQCAGFLRIIPETAGVYDDYDSNPNESQNLLDQTWIHPESYKVANQILDYCNCDMGDYGSPDFAKRIKDKIPEVNAALADRFNTDVPTIEFIIKALTMAKNEDMRGTSEPLYRTGITNISDVEIGSILTGAVRNVTQFGTFVDIGVGTDGLIPLKYLNGETLRVNQRVRVILKDFKLKGDADLHKDMITLEHHSNL